MSTKLKYGNWIRKKKLWQLGLAAAGLAGLAALPLPLVWRVVLGCLSLVVWVSFLFPLAAYCMFAPQGGNLQEKIYTLIILSLQPPLQGKILDIGAGNGVLAVRLARFFAEVSVIGLDDWGRDWEYAQAVCAENAHIAEVTERVQFVKGDAAALDFPEAEFAAVVSNLTFHEVKAVAQKSAVVKEALRVLKPGGVFAFVDYFYDSRYYGQPAELEAQLRSWGIAQVTLQPLTTVLALPAFLRHPKALGKVGLIYGRK